MCGELPSFVQRKEPNRVRVQRDERNQLSWTLVREMPAPRQWAAAARLLGAQVGLYLHRARRSVPGGVHHQIDPGIGGQPRTVDSELEKLILHQQLAGGADVLDAHDRRLALNAAAIPNPAVMSRAAHCHLAAMAPESVTDHRLPFVLRHARTCLPSRARNQAIPDSHSSTADTRRTAGW